MIVTRCEIGYTDMELTLRAVIREVSQEGQGGWMNGQTDGQVGEWMDRWKNGQTDG